MGFDILLELFMGFIGVSIALAIFGLVRNPQIPAMVAFGGMFILVIAVSTDNIITGQLVDTSSTSGPITDYSYTPDKFPFTELPKLLFSLIGVVMILTGGLMVYKT